MILYLRVVPGLCTAVEEQRRPELRSCPVIMGGLPHQRGVVREANVLAQRCGVHSGMTLAQAHQQCPDGVFLVPDMPCYEAIWEEICSLLGAYTPLVEPVEMGQAVCDLSGCERRWSNGWSVASDISQQVRRSTGITPWLGVAPNWLVAQLASTTVGADGITVVEAGQERAFLADLPLTLLPDIDPRLALTFQVLGLKTIGQLAALPASAVKQRFGSVGELLHRYARGIDRRPVLPPPAKPSVSARYECEDGTPDEAVAAIHRLAHTCASELQSRHLAGKLIELTLLWKTPLTPSPPLPRVGEGVRGLGDEGTRAMSLGQVTEPEGNPFPISYRIHSMLPQPGSYPSSEPSVARTSMSAPSRMGRVSFPLPGSPAPPVDAKVRAPAGSVMRSRGEGVQLAATVRTPIDSPAPLAERAQQLLLQKWPQAPVGAAPSGRPPHRLQAIELKISEFAAPVQQSFEEFLRLDQTGRLSGLTPGRLLALAEQEELLEARYGDAAFRHVCHMDPYSILTERRFHWQAGLPWQTASRQRNPRGDSRDQAVF